MLDVSKKEPSTKHGQIRSTNIQHLTSNIFLPCKTNQCCVFSDSAGWEFCEVELDSLNGGLGYGHGISVERNELRAEFRIGVTDGEIKFRFDITNSG